MPAVLFRAAGGPRLGFGHIVRALSLAKALDVPPRLSIRGTRETARAAARLGADVCENGLASAVRDADLMVIDDPHVSSARRALATARRAGLPVASLHDVGVAPIASDLAIDGSLARRRARWPAREVLRGARYAVLDPTLLDLAVAESPRREPFEVLVSLGGGRRVAIGLRAACAIAEAWPHVRVTLAAGFGGASAATGHPRVRFLASPAALRPTLARADVAVLAAGVTLYEAAALGVPAIAVAVVSAQAPTTRAFHRHGAATEAGLLRLREPARAARTIARLVRIVGELLEDDRRRARLAARARHEVDGQGARRVAARLRELARRREA